MKEVLGHQLYCCMPIIAWENLCEDLTHLLIYSLCRKCAEVEEQLIVEDMQRRLRSALAARSVSHAHHCIKSLCKIAFTMFTRRFLRR